MPAIDFDDLHPRDPATGEFVDKNSRRGTPGQVDLDVDAASARAAALASAGFVPAVVTNTRTTAEDSSEASRRVWWDTGFVVAERATGVAYPQMRDDNTPSRSAGQSLSGNRRTHRMRYRSDDATIQMPSATACRRFANEVGGSSFDVPVMVTTNGGSQQGWVRVTRGQGGTWGARPLGQFANPDAVGEAVRTVLEARHPRSALDGRSLRQLHLKRKASAGTESIPVEGTFIQSVGYDAESRTAYVGMGGTNKDGSERSYAYHGVSPVQFRELVTAQSKGRAYNKLIKGGHTSSRVHQCPDCGRFCAVDASHTCPTGDTAPAGPVAQNHAAAERARRVLADTAAPTPQPVSGGAASTDEVGSLRTWAVQEWDRSMESGQLDPSKPSEFGPGVPRGFTMRPDTASAIEPFVDREHNPEQFRDGDKRLVSKYNGDVGLMHFSGLGRDGARTLLKNLPQPNLNRRVAEQGPRIGVLLAAVANSGGRLEAHGWVVPPSRTDERVDVNGVYAFIDTDSPVRARMEVASMGLRGGNMKAPTMERVEVPWRPGEMAWRLEW